MQAPDGLPVETAVRFMAQHTFRTCLRRQWVHEDPQAPDAVAIRLGKRDYVLHPVDERLNAFQLALNELNCEIAVTFSADVAKVVAASLTPDAHVFSLTDSNHIQVVETMADLAHARIAQHACFIRDEHRIVIWADQVEELEETVQDFESKLVSYVMQRTLRPGFHSRSTTYSTLTSSPSTPKLPPSPSFTSLIQQEFIDEKAQDKELENAEAGALPAPARRRLPLNQSIYAGLSTSVVFVLLATTARPLLKECLLDGNWMRMTILAALPALACIYMFLSETAVGIVAQIFFPIGVTSSNTLFYSAIPSPRNITGVLPHMTVLMPVYKEDLVEVLAPTIESISRAIRTYELQGGTASIIISEDGLQLVDADEQEKRKDYYDRMNVAWVARPPSGRAGRFKKSSNLNVTHALSLRIEELMDERRPTGPQEVAAWTQVDEDRLYESTLQAALDEKNGEVWASGNVRHGEYILLIDSDTRVPPDCFLDAVCEMEAEPFLGLLQHQSGAFLAGAGYFETFMSFLTVIVNHMISFNVANGGSAPVMGHNCFIRWSAAQHQALNNPDNKVWDEGHVSEDYVLYMNLNASFLLSILPVTGSSPLTSLFASTRAGYITRWATYAHGEFREGVSLTCDEELNRWQKYAFGASEIMFNPIKSWLTKGPISMLFLRYLFGPTPLPTKLANCSYMSSYWAMAVGPPMILAFYFLQGNYAEVLSSAFVPAFQIIIAALFVYNACGTLAIIISRYRSQSATLFTASKEAILAIPCGLVFWAGLQFHVLTALLAHVTSYNITWSATKKEVETPTIQEEFPVVLKRHWLTFLLSIVIIAGVAVSATSIVPIQWRIEAPTIQFPILWVACAHLLYPILLNPAVMLWRF
ncbi:hypothetical protein JCM6882_000009 [Rhodosporidiobolus microsporus]